MKLKFNFSGKTLLRDWWKIVKDNFSTVETEFNSHVSDFEAAKKKLQGNIDAEISARASADKALGERINSEASARASADTELGERIDSEASARSSADMALDGRINSEVSARASADAALDGRINSEASARSSADTTLAQNINSEISARESADEAIGGRIDEIKLRLEAFNVNAHSHANKEVLDSITEDDVEKWNGIKTQVSAKELNEAVEYLEEISFGLETQLELFLNAVGVITYNGGRFVMEQNETALDGGELDSEQSETIDCGDFSPLCITLADSAIIKGGEY